MKIETFDSVWDAVSAPPEQAENMRIRAELVTIINNWIEQQGFS
ncbi:XRE family transcriptional regulator, partial [Escherichia coli]|nr:XRE family transcriptional regulator [Escherichia coli]